jgi:phosphatidate cytidylyltransferase
MHLKRWITGLVALPFLIFLVYKGGFLFTILISLAGLVALWEYYRIVFNADARPISRIIFYWGYGVSFALIWSTFLEGPDLTLSVIGLNLLVVALISLFQFKTDRTVLYSGLAFIFDSHPGRQFRHDLDISFAGGYFRR